MMKSEVSMMFDRVRMGSTERMKRRVARTKDSIERRKRKGSIGRTRRKGSIGRRKDSTGRRRMMSRVARTKDNIGRMKMRGSTGRRIVPAISHEIFKIKVIYIMPVRKLVKLL